MQGSGTDASAERSVTAPRRADEAREHDSRAKAQRDNRPRLWLGRIGGYVGVLGLWLLLSYYVLNQTTLPPPQAVIKEMLGIIASGDLLPNLAYTLRTFAVVFLISYPVGVVVGILMGRSPYWDAFFRDMVVTGLTTPAIVFIFIGLIFFGLSPWGRILAVVVSVTPLVTINVVEGVSAVPKDLVDMSKAYGVDRLTRMRHVILPGIAPFLFSGARYAVAVGLRGSALVELFGAPAGLGFQLRQAFDSFSVSGALAWTLYIVLLVLLVERVVFKRAERWFFKWRQEAF